jgi:hypothetical protein
VRESDGFTGTPMNSPPGNRYDSSGARIVRILPRGRRRRAAEGARGGAIRAGGIQETRGTRARVGMSSRNIGNISPGL